MYIWAKLTNTAEDKMGGTAGEQPTDPTFIHNFDITEGAGGNGTKDINIEWIPVQLST